MKLLVTIELWRAARCTEIECFQTVSDKSVISKTIRYIPPSVKGKISRETFENTNVLVSKTVSARDSAIRSLDAQLWQPRAKCHDKRARFEKSTLKAQKWNETFEKDRGVARSP